MPSLSVVVPCFNEEGSLETFIPLLAAQRVHFSAFEIIVVDDGSRDRSPEIIRRLTDRFALRCITHPTNLGLGAAVRAGYDAATMEWLTYLPADGQVPAEEVQRLLPYMDGYDVIIGRRSGRSDYTRYRRLASRVYTAWVSLAFGLRVTDFNWVQAWRRPLWEQYPSISTSVFVCAEFLVRCRPTQVRMVEIPIGYRPRASGRAKNGSPRAALLAARDITRLFLSECRAGRLPLLFPVTPDRPGAAPGSTHRAA